MRVRGDGKTSRQPLYNGRTALRLSWRLQRFTAAAVLGVVAAGGCSFPLETMFDKAQADIAQTASVAALGEGQAAAGASPPEGDLAYVRAVAAAALGGAAKDSSVPWENPHTGASGNITPLAVSYSEGAFVCRDFLASYVRGQSQAWLQGEACRSAHGTWEVKSLKPFRS